MSFFFFHSPPKLTHPPGIYHPFHCVNFIHTPIAKRTSVFTHTTIHLLAQQTWQLSHPLEEIRPFTVEYEARASAETYAIQSPARASAETYPIHSPARASDTPMAKCSLNISSDTGVLHSSPAPLTHQLCVILGHSTKSRYLRHLQ